MTLKLEKAQVSALARFLGRMLGELERPGELPTGDQLALEPFAEPDFVVRSLGVTYDDESDRIILVADEVDRTEGRRRARRAVRPSRRRRSGCRRRRQRQAHDDPGAGGRPCHSRHGARRGGSTPLPAVRVSARRERPRVPEDERPPAAADLSEPAWLELLAAGELEIEGRLPWSSNYSFLVDGPPRWDRAACRLQAGPRRAPALGLSGRPVPP